MGTIGLGFFKRRRVWISVGAVVVTAWAVALLTRQDHLKPEEFLGALGWDTKPDSLLIFPETGAGPPRLPRSAPDRRTGLLNMLRSDLFSTSAFLRELNRAPLAAPSHSIIPVAGDPDDPFANDGIVPLSSARVPVAASELILTGDHGSFDAPETLVELRRILRKHANLPPSVEP